MTDILALQATLAGLHEELEKVIALLAQELDDPAEFLSLKADLEAMITEHEGLIANARPTPSVAPQQPSTSAELPDTKNVSPPVEKPKFDMEKHPAFRKTQDRAPVEAASAIPHLYTGGDKVLVQVKHQWTRATVKTVMGPNFYVFVEATGEHTTVRSDQIKPIVDSRKRKAESSFTSSVSAPKFKSGSSVITAAANINPALASQAKREPSMVSDGPTRPAKIPKKLSTTKSMEIMKSNWQAFNKGGNKKMKKSHQKESMFRTGEAFKARVGVVGSGQEMRKDIKRSRHVYKQDDNEDEEDN